MQHHHHHQQQQQQLQTSASTTSMLSGQQHIHEQYKNYSQPDQKFNASYMTGLQ
jgi:hypothetical protein